MICTSSIYDKCQLEKKCLMNKEKKTINKNVFLADIFRYKYKVLKYI